MEPEQPQQPDPAEVMRIIADMPAELIQEMAQYLPAADMHMLQLVNQHSQAAVTPSLEWGEWLTGLSNRLEAIFSDADTVPSEYERDEQLAILEEFIQNGGGRVRPVYMPEGPWNALVQDVRDLKRSAIAQPQAFSDEQRERIAKLPDL